MRNVKCKSRNVKKGSEDGFAEETGALLNHNSRFQSLKNVRDEETFFINIDHTEF